MGTSILELGRYDWGVGGTFQPSYFSSTKPEKFPKRNKQILSPYRRFEEISKHSKICTIKPHENVKHLFNGCFKLNQHMTLPMVNRIPVVMSSQEQIILGVSPTHHERPNYFKN